MRCSTVVTSCLLVIPLLASLFGLVDSISFLRPTKIQVSRYTEAEVHLNKPLSPLLSALFTRLRQWEQPSASPRYVPMADTANYTLLVNNTNKQPTLVTLDNVPLGEVRLYTYPESNQIDISGKYWEMSWEMQLSGEITASATCWDQSCLCVVYQDEPGMRVRFTSLQADFDDFALPHTGNITALTVSNSSIVYGDDQDSLPFITLNLVPIDEIVEDDMVLLLKSDSAWVLTSTAVQVILNNSTAPAVIGLQHVSALDIDWVIVTSLTTDSSTSTLFTHLYYSVNRSEWVQFSDFHYNVTFFGTAKASVSYSVGDSIASQMSASVSLVGSQHWFLAYSW